MPPSFAARPRRLAIVASRLLSGSALALIWAGVNAAGLGASAFLTGSGFLASSFFFSFGGVGLVGLGVSLTTSF